ncbi:MAG: hypothetical protein SWX82_20070, partial [Cyanobacteriota bacterium]|nr:hypothetical protein [Cyanobacteriota bacterium]
YQLRNSLLILFYPFKKGGAYPQFFGNREEYLPEFLLLVNNQLLFEISLNINLKSQTLHPI